VVRLRADIKSAELSLKSFAADLYEALSAIVWVFAMR
jgi:hypothetical protein